MFTARVDWTLPECVTSYWMFLANQVVLQVGEGNQVIHSRWSSKSQPELDLHLATVCLALLT